MTSAQLFALKLPPGRTEAEALSVAISYRKQIWRYIAWSEDRKITELERVCTNLCCDDKASGEELAKRSIYN